ncbi:mediator of DNA damage checkpoint protein 1 isoform X2 [Dermochelys coriacea]|uniref:mediator of DNA damage checkpoint protein 1 isoform X2 n=1 Tax=Dermochelys coriacea TaxID=27794 RepID=UPI0018E83805|nr:mediator of DNA damage checkpoint protein 1 isoform X2 [Dermochelys coriacea]
MTGTDSDQSEQEKALREAPGWPIRGLPAGTRLEGAGGLQLEQEAMEQTQLLEWGEDGDPPGGEADGEAPQPVGRLHLLSSKYGPEQDFWIYPGENVVGRLPSCQVCLPAPSVSKAHAVIEIPVPDGPHLLYDRGSLNRTRRQRAVLLPHVRYSLEDGDTLMFGDVGCQYFLLPLVDADPEDSLEVPPTQPRVPKTLAIEETPAPSKRMGYGALLARDSEDEEESQGGGRLLQLLGSNGSVSSSDTGARSDTAFSSPCATVVPESDEEGGETPDAPCPSLRLSYGSEKTPGPPENRVTALGPKQPRAMGVVGTDREPALAACCSVKGPGHTGIASGTGHGPAVGGLGNGFPAEVGSVTDVEEEERHPDLVQKNHGPAVLGDSDTDVEEVVENLDVVDPKSHAPAIEMGSDTDVEEEVENADVYSKGHQLAGNGDSDTDVEGAGVNPDVGPKRHQPRDQMDSDTDVEEDVAKNPDVQQNHQPTFPGGRETDVEGGVENPDDMHPESHHSAKDGESDTDVEEVVENPDVQKSHQPAVEVGSDTDVEEEKAETPVVVQNNHQLVSPGGRDVDVAQAVGKPDVHPKGHRPAGNEDSDTDVEEFVGNPDVTAKSHPPTIDVGSDTDVEEEAAKNPDVVTKNHQLALPGDRAIDVMGMVGKPDVHPKGYRPAGNEDSDTDVEESGGNPDVVQRSHRPTVEAGDDTDVEEAEGKPYVGRQTGPLPVTTGDSDTDVEENPDVGQQTLHLPTASGDSDTDVEGAPGAEFNQAPGLVGGPAQAGGEELPAPQSHVSPEAKVMDTEGNKEPAWGPAQPGDDSETDVEDSGSTLEEEATQTFVFRSPLPAKGSVMSPPAGPALHAPVCTSSEKEEEEEDLYVLGATQSFCEDPGLHSDQPTQPFTPEEDTQLLPHHPPLGGALSQEPAQPAVPGPASGGLLPLVTQAPAAARLSPKEESEPPGRALPAGGAGRELPEEEESQPVRLVLSAPRRVTLALQGEGGRAGAEPGGSSSGQRLRRQGGLEAAGRWETPAAVGVTGAGAHPKGAQPEDARKVPEAHPSPSTPVRRRSLRSAPVPAPPPPAPAPERRSRRGGTEKPVGSGDPNQPIPAAPQRRGRRQLCSPAVYMEAPEPGSVEEVEQPGPVKRPKGALRTQDPPTEPEALSQAAPGRARRSRGAAGTEPARVHEPRRGSGRAEPEAPQGRAQRSQRAPAQEPVPRRRGAAEPAREARGKRRGVATPDLPQARGEGQVGSATAREDAGSGARKRQEAPVPPLCHQSTENKVEGLRARAPRRSQGAASGMTSPRVLFTGVIDEAGERVVSALGGALALSVFDCTHLVTDRVRRTVKFLCALARGVPIVTLDWLDKSGRSACFLSPSGFLVHDTEQERNFHFSLAQSLQRARRGALLQGYEIHVTPNVKPEPEHMKDIIQCSGGVFLPHMPRTYKDKRIVISCPEDLPCCRPALSARLPVASTEFLLTGILQQAVDLASYRLDGTPAPPPPSAATPATRGSKRKGASGPAPTLPRSAKRRR